jgi:hypothetical protein
MENEYWSIIPKFINLFSTSVSYATQICLISIDKLINQEEVTSQQQVAARVRQLLHLSS